MSPIDDELRAALHGRAQVLTPSPDPLAGIERRARRMRRNRAGAAVAGSALAVAMIAVAVPALQSAVAPRQDVPNMAASNPPVADLDPSLYALDPQDPWDFRGIPVSEQDRALIQQEYATRTGGSQVRITPLYGGFDESTSRNEVVFLADVDGKSRWGIAAYPTEAGLEIVWDEPLPEPALALAAALPGEQAPRLVLVTTPKAVRIFYGTDGSDAASVSSTEPGVAVVPLDRDRGSDYYGVRVDGDELVRAPAPEPKDITQVEPAPPGDEVPAPANAVDWPTRGGVSADLLEQAVTAFSQTAGVSRDGVGSRLLYAGSRGDFVYLLLQAWSDGDARSYAWRYDTRDGSTAAVLQAATPPGPAVLASSIDGVLIVVPEPAAGQVLYSPDSRAEPQPVPDQGTGAAVLIDRLETRKGDRLLILDGNGNPDRPIYRGTVEELLGSTAS